MTQARQPGSIRSRLMRLQWMALLLTGAVCGVVSFALTWNTVNDLRDLTLEQVAQSVVRHGLEMEGDDDTNSADVPDKGQFTSQIWTQDNTLYYSSANDDGPPRQSPGWHRLVWQQQEWHVYTLLQDGLTIQVSQPSQSREHIFWRIAPGLALAMAAVTAGLYGLLHLAATWSLRPMVDLRQQLESAKPQALQVQLAKQPWPDELQPLVTTLSNLLDRLADARQAQQHLVARAAHEFRTPLAALKIHAQLLGRSSPDGQHTDHNGLHREHLLHAVDRMTRLVDQLLKLAEFDAPTEPLPPKSVAVMPWIQEPLRLWQALAQAQGVQVLVDVPPNAHLLCHPHAMLAMLDNLVHNALRHSPPGSTVALCLHLAADNAVWQLVDHGPGMTPLQRTQAGQTFVSMPGVQSDGSGLGLAIATRVAALHGGSLKLLETPGGGLTVEMHLPQVSAA